MYMVSKTSSGPICRYYIAILISSLRDTFLPKIWVKKRVKLGKFCRKCQKTSSGPTCRYYIANLISSLRDTFFPKIWVKKRVKLGKFCRKCQKTSTGPTCRILLSYFFGGRHLEIFKTPKHHNEINSSWCWVSRKCTRCQITLSGPTCRYYIAILKSSLRDTFWPRGLSS